MSLTTVQKFILRLILNQNVLLSSNGQSLLILLRLLPTRRSSNHRSRVVIICNRNGTRYPEVLWLGSLPFARGRAGRFARWRDCFFCCCRGGGAVPRACLLRLCVQGFLSFFYRTMECERDARNTRDRLPSLGGFERKSATYLLTDCLALCHHPACLLPERSVVGGVGWRAPPNVGVFQVFLGRKTRWGKDALRTDAGRRDTVRTSVRTLGKPLSA
ncbi:uncharacterized protein EV422DRAFT_263957 [Fimicolochytrium jonesii]|uniref:uncharacterized protein n=1 Tax=Fimicolochytrium jonesii TaxID=1396493 RepID=UPI0022FDB3E0|nr:uncharacterized protein EV422DRAFT_263957 [Fimicolochytrium jonesii]KAI8817072.1 hypothetical protein EV422DRAFT_263957 [Fimicolochytrium jonesii]